MAVTKAKADPKPEPSDHNADPALGASGGAAAEGYALPNRVTATKGVAREEEGIFQRGADGDHERFVAAKKFMDAKREAGELEAKTAADVAAGKPDAGKELADKRDEVQKERDEKAAKKPTVVGGDTAALASPVGGQSAAQTEKDEKAAAAPAEGGDKDKAKK